MAFESLESKYITVLSFDFVKSKLIQVTLPQTIDFISSLGISYHMSESYLIFYSILNFDKYSTNRIK